MASVCVVSKRQLGTERMIVLYKHRLCSELSTEDVIWRYSDFVPMSYPQCSRTLVCAITLLHLGAQPDGARLRDL